MAFESFKRFNKKEENIRDTIDAVTREADPSTYSMRSPENMRTKILRSPDEINLPARTAQGETYYELDASEANMQEGQQVISRMLKGILNVSDIVSLPNTEGDKKFYSLKTSLRRIEQDTTKEQFVADQMLLEYIFNSNDHLFNTTSNWANNGRFEKGKAVHFDFGEDASYFLRKPEREPLLTKLRQQTPETLSYLGNKVSELQHRFDGEEGRQFLKAIIDASHTPVTELFGPSNVFETYTDIEPFDLVYRTLIGRIEGLSKFLNEVSVGQSQNSRDAEEAAELLRKMKGEL